MPITTRNRDDLNWRFLQPSANARIFSIKKNKIFYGYFVTKIVIFSGLRFLVVLDYLVSKKLTYLDCLFIRLWLIKKSLQLNVDFLFFMLNKRSPMSNFGKNFPMIELSDSRLPHATPIYFRIKNVKDDIKDALVFMHFTLGDIDYF